MNPNYRKDFPLIDQSALIYFDNAATTQKPKSVLSAVERYYEKDNANPLRGIYDLSVRATEDYEDARETVRDFIGADKMEEIIFTRNATESINLVAFSYGMSQIQKGDEIVVSIMEHHSNILPWQNVCRQKGAVLKYIYCDQNGRLNQQDLMEKITDKTKIVAITQVSNVLGQVNPVKDVISLAHQHGAVVLVDGSQSVPHMPVNVQDLDADFLVFSGHKMMAPMGIGVLYGKEKLLNAMPPFLTGGEMIDSVTEQDATFTELPHKFEAGTVNCSGAVGLAEAIRYIQKVGFDYIRQQEDTLTHLMMDEMNAMPEIELIGSKDWKDHQGIVSFNIKEVHPHDAASILNEKQVAIRAGHHCAQPLLHYMGVSFSLRASVYFYNTEDEVRRFIESLKGVRRWMGYGSETDL